MQTKLKAGRSQRQAFYSKASGLSLLIAGLAAAPQLSPHIALAASRPGDGLVITHDLGAERKAFQRAQKEQAKALKQRQRFEATSIPDKRTRRKLQNQEKQNFKLQRKLQQQWFRQHQWSQQH